MLLAAVRTILLFAAVTIVMRLMGKRQVGEMQPFELVIAVLIAELAAIPMEDTDIPLLNGVVPIVVLLVAQILLSELTLWSEGARRVICGTPSILISHGKIVKPELRRLRINLNDLMEQLRNKDYPDIRDVDFAVLETNGQLSVIPKPGSGPVTGDAIGITTRRTGLPISLILDGKLNLHNLHLANMDVECLKKAAQAQGIDDLSRVFFASVDNAGDVYFQLGEDWSV